MNWNIITDSSCDLLPSTSPDGRIQLTSVPFTIRIGERDFVDDEHLDTLEMLSAMEQERSAGHTSCPTPDAWLAQFEQADCAIAITISSQLSGSMNSALAARDMALEKDPDKKDRHSGLLIHRTGGSALRKGDRAPDPSGPFL